MDDARFERDLPTEPPTPATRRFAAIAEGQDATYPMLAPAMATHMDVEDMFDEEILAGLVNV
jgi:hypothetical protein